MTEGESLFLFLNDCLLRLLPMSMLVVDFFNFKIDGNPNFGQGYKIGSAIAGSESSKS